MGTSGTKTPSTLSQALRVALPLWLRASSKRRSPLAHPPEGGCEGVLFGACPLRPRGRLLQGQAHRVGLGPGWHTGKEVEIPEGIHLQFLPARSPELQPAERLWPLANEAVANRLFEDLDELEEALVERCVALLEQTDLIRSHTLYHWWLDAA